MRSDYIFRQNLEHILASLEYENRLILETCLATGLRLSDVLHLRTAQLAGAPDGKGKRTTVRERKTGKSRTVFLSAGLLRKLQHNAGRKYVFEGRFDWKVPKTRQAVWKDLKKAAVLFRCKGNISPHSCRKVWAVEQYHKDGDLKRVQRLLNHDREAVTMLYAMADEITGRGRRRGHR